MVGNGGEMVYLRGDGGEWWGDGVFERRWCI